jgi:hypothetical protein
MDPSRRENKKRLIAMVSWTIPLASIVEKMQMTMILQTIPLTHILEKMQIAMVYIMEKNADDNDLAYHPTNPHHGKNADSNGLIDPFDTASIFYLLIVLQKILIITLEIEKKRLVDMIMTRSIL